MNKSILVVAAVIYRGFSTATEVAIFRRGPEQSGAGSWEFPGGKVEPGESEIQALRREIEEELGVQIQVEDFIAENVHQYPDKKVRLRFYWVPFPRQEFVLTDHDDFRWLKPSELEPDLLSAADRPIVATVKLDPRFKA